MRPIPTHIDDPIQVLIWEFDEFILLSILFCIGILSGHLLKCVLLGIGVVKLFKRYKDRQANGFLVHMLYWHSGLGSSERPFSSLPIPFIRRYF